MESNHRMAIPGTGEGRDIYLALQLSTAVITLVLT